MIDLLKLASALEANGDRPAALYASWEGQSFDIVAGSPRNAVLIKMLRRFDGQSAKEIEAVYSDLCTKSSGWLFGKSFTIVILSEAVAIEAEAYFDWTSRLWKIYTRARLYDVKNGGGSVAVADLQRKELLPRADWLSWKGRNVGAVLREHDMLSPWGRALSSCW